jgi:N-methylhydantoinase B
MTRLSDDDVVIARNSGGGGWGDPLSRDPLHVLADVRDGAVSPQWARDGYGVVIVGDDVDAEATRNARNARRLERLAVAPGGQPPAKNANECRHVQGGAEVLATRRRLRDLGAWVLPFQDHEHFHGVEHICSACGTLLDVLVVQGTSELATTAG